ncbi:MAG: AMP-binding protein [Enhygromyxa sp.]
MNADSDLERMLAGLRRYPKRRAVGLRAEFGLRWWRYDRLACEVRCAAVHLRNLGVVRGARVMIWGRNSPEWVAWFLALLVRGAVAIPVDLRNGEDFARRVIEESGITVVLHEVGTPLTAPHGSAVMILAMVVPSKIDAAYRDAPWPETETAPGDPALVMFSSGSTATPRGILVTRENLASQLRGFRRLRRVARLARVRLLFVPPLSHIFGVVVGICVPLYLGLSVFYVRESNPRQLCRVIRDNRGMIVAMVPSTLRTLSRELHAHVGDVPGSTRSLRRARRRMLGRHCRMFVLGGARLPLADEALWRRTGLGLMQGYGLTETAAIVSLSNPFARTPGTLGRPRSAVELELADDGEVWVRGPGLSPGVLLAGEVEPLAGDEDGFVPTGDLATRDAKGRLLFVGRKHGMLVTAQGHNLFPADIEAVLDAQETIAESAVVGREVDGAVHAHAWLVPRRSGAEVDQDARLAEAVFAANEQLASHQRVHSWARWPGDALPRSGLGKLQRPRIEAQAGEGSPPPTPELASILASEDSARRIERLAAFLAAGVPAHQRDLKLSAHLGLDSVDLAELVARLENEVGPGRGPALVVDPDLSLGELERMVQGDEHAAAPVRMPARGPAYALRWPMTWLRALVRPLLLGLWTLTAARVRVEAHVPLDSLRGPLIFAGQPHLQRLDLWVVALALPRRLRRKTGLVTAARFEHYFAPGPQTTTRQRIKHAIAYYVALPLFMPFAILSNRDHVHAGMCSAGALLDRRYNLLGFPFDSFLGPEAPPTPGLARLAAESGLPLVPLYFEGTGDLRWPWKFPRDRIIVHVGAPIELPHHLPRDQMIARVQAGFQRLREQALASPRHADD